MRLMVRAAVLFVLALGMCTPGFAEELRIDTHGRPRSALLLTAPNSRAPTVIVLHGALISAEYTASWYGFAEAAKRYRFAAVFPRGINMLWNDGRKAALGSGADDVAFLKRLARELVSRGTADPARLYLVGVSNGGMMAFRMLCEAPDPFAGMATIIASMPAAVGAACRSSRAMPVMMFNGTADPLIPYGGGGVGWSSWQGRIWPVERTAAFLAHRNGCRTGSKAVVSGRAAPGAMRVVRLDWRSCSSERRVTLYRVEGGGHQVFGRTNFLPLLLGPGTRRISAPDIIMAAFGRGEL